MYEISVIDKTYSKIISDETKFYTSDTALELCFELKETDYNFESAEIVLLNIDDRSLVTRPVSKVNNDFVYELDDDIIPHYGEWHCQVRFEQGETYVSSPVKFRIENDLSNDRPPQLSDVQSWVSLKRYADGLVDELKQAVLSVDGIEDTFNENELVRQTTFETVEQSRQSTFETNESERYRIFNTNEDIRQTQELEREKSEVKRQSEFDDNETNRTETFNTNEVTRIANEEARELAENERENAETQRKTDHANRSAELDGKADKKQEDWITPTLLGGSTGTVAYLKDEFGFVHFKGRVSNAGNLLTMFVMPSGYRPDLTSDFIVFSTAGAKIVRVNNSGNVDNSNSQPFVELSSIVYKAER